MFVSRNPDSAIYGAWTVRQFPGQEELPDNNPEVVAFTTRPQPSLDVSDINNLDKVLKAIGMLLRQYANQLKAGIFVTKSVADLRADFAAVYQSLP